MFDPRDVEKMLSEACSQMSVNTPGERISKEAFVGFMRQFTEEMQIVTNPLLAQQIAEQAADSLGYLAANVYFTVTSGSPNLPAPIAENITKAMRNSILITFISSFLDRTNDPNVRLHKVNPLEMKGSA